MQGLKDIKVSKRKTMVLYSGRELNGKAVLQVTVSKNIQEDLSQKNESKFENSTNIELSFLKKELFNKSKKTSKLN